MSDSKRKETTVITAATMKRVTVHPGKSSIFAQCGQCGTEVLMLTPTEAGVLSGTTAREIFRRVEAGELHFLEMADGALLICRNSL